MSQPRKPVRAPSTIIDDEDKQSRGSYVSLNKILSSDDSGSPLTYEEPLKIDLLREQLDELQKSYQNQYKKQTIIFTILDRKQEILIKVTDEERRYVMKSTMQLPSQLNLRQPIFFLSEINFKQDVQKITAESESLTKKLQQYLNSQGLSDQLLSSPNILQCLKTLLEDLLESFHNLTLSHVQITHKTPYKFERSQIHYNCIPYPAIAFTVWSPFGQLLTVQNAQTQKVSQEQRGELMTLKDVNNFIYATSKKRNIEMRELNKNKQQTFIQDFQDTTDDFQTDFVHQGMKIIAEGETEEQDFLNFQSSNVQTYFSHFQQDDTHDLYNVKRDKKYPAQRDVNSNTTTNINQNYEFFDLSKDFLSQQFKNLLSKIEQDEKKISANPNTLINIYNFSRYNYSAIDQVSHFLDHVLNLRKKPENSNQSSPLFMYQVALKEYFSTFKSHINHHFQEEQKQKRCFEEEQYQLEFIQIILQNIMKIWLQKNSILNQIESVVYFHALGWETLLNTLSLKDQLYALFLDIRNLPQTDRILRDLKIAKSSTKDLEYPKIQHDLVKHILPHFTIHMKKHLSCHRKLYYSGSSEFIPKACDEYGHSQMNKNCQIKLKKFNQLESTKYTVKTTQRLIQHKNLRFISLLNLMNKDQKAKAFPSQYVLKSSIQVSNPALCQRFLKEHQKYLDVQEFIIYLNQSLHFINQGDVESLIYITSQSIGSQVKEVQSFDCSVCQIKLCTGQYLTCSKCHHGGHYQHIVDWFKKKNLCPQCFECCCFQIN